MRRVRRWCEDLGISSSLELRRWLPFFLCMRIEVQDVMMILIDGGCAMTARFSTNLARAGTSRGVFGASFHVVRNVRYPLLMFIAVLYGFSFFFAREFMILYDPRTMSDLVCSCGYVSY